jgi:hypothetical protein
MIAMMRYIPVMDNTEILQIALQLVLGLGILNVWLIRRKQSTPYRGKEAGNITEEFAAYGLPAWSVWVIGGLKILCALGLLAGIWVESLVIPSANLLAVLMLGACFMHLKVKDPLKKSVPALALLACCLALIFLH